MNEIAIQLGLVLCRGAIQLGVGGLRCYEQMSLQSLGWSAAAFLMILAMLTIKWMGKFASR
jgi:hypothetical protein